MFLVRFMSVPLCQVHKDSCLHDSVGEGPLGAAEGDSMRSPDCTAWYGTLWHLLCVAVDDMAWFSAVARLNGVVWGGT